MGTRVSSEPGGKKPRTAKQVAADKKKLAAKVAKAKKQAAAAAKTKAAADKRARDQAKKGKKPSKGISYRRVR